tara:strand:+ start:22 stop:522 length:501 start_codon:yes stop_codon:yes gene_type:complete
MSDKIDRNKKESKRKENKNTEKQTSSVINKFGDNNDKYVRPKQTFQDKLTPKQIQELLLDYVEVKDISTVDLNTHIRYFSIQDDGKKLFRTGGFLVNKKEVDKYVILSNNKQNWSVNTKKSIFFKKLSSIENKQMQNDEVEELKQVIKKLYNENNKLKKKIKNLEK